MFWACALCAALLQGESPFCCECSLLTAGLLLLVSSECCASCGQLCADRLQAALRVQCVWRSVRTAPLVEGECW